MTTTELSQVVNFIAKTSEYQNSKVGFAVSKSDIEVLGYKVHLYAIKEDGTLPKTFGYIKTFAPLDNSFIKGVTVLVRHNDETNQVEFQIF